MAKYTPLTSQSAATNDELAEEHLLSSSNTYGKRNSNDSISDRYHDDIRVDRRLWLFILLWPWVQVYKIYNSIRLYSRRADSGLLSTVPRGRTICQMVLLFVLVVAASTFISCDRRVRDDGVVKRFWSVKSNDLDATLLKEYRAPPDVKVKALVFFGRRQTASILACFLERNLKRNGGLQDEVVWMQGTEVDEEVEWMYDVVNATDGFSAWYNYHYATSRSYVDAYAIALNETHEGETVYVKVDDDVVFLEDTAVASLVHRLLTDPHNPFLVGANVVNQPALAWVHYSMGAVDGYMPELDPSLSRDNETDYEEPLPLWSGPEEYRVPDVYQSPVPSSRWLPVNQSAWPIDRTPIARVYEFDAFNNGWRWWPIGAQQHYSLLGRLARNELSALKFDKWDFNYVRMGIQFIAIRRKDILAHYPFPTKDDEQYLSVIAPHKLERRAIVDGRNVVAHYSFGHQYKGMDSTDVLKRYQSFALTNICSATLEDYVQ